MRKVYASGAVVFRREREGVLFLLIYSGRNRIWGFPKGHVEPGEEERAAAAREIREETGLTGLALLEGFREEDVYEVPRPEETIEKHSVYYLAETADRDIAVDGDEITDYRWLPREKAAALLPFEGIRRVLARAAAFLDGMTEKGQ